MSTPLAHPPAQDHELYVWNADELLEDIHKAREGAHAAVEMNEGLKRSFDADAVAIAQLIKSGNQIARQIRLLASLAGPISRKSEANDTSSSRVTRNCGRI